MQLYVIAGLILGVLGTLIFAFARVYAAGKTAQRTGDLKRAEGIREKQLEEANKPRDPANVVDILRRGEF